MKIIARICLLFIALGIVLGWFVWGGFAGSAVGLMLAGCLAVPLYCLSSVFAYNRARVVWNNPLEASVRKLDPSQLPEAAYEPHGGAGSM